MASCDLPTVADTGKSKPNNSKLSRPMRGEQGRRLGGRFAGLEGRLDTPEGLAELRSDPGSIAPERAIVFELTGGDPKNFYTALRNIPGFEFLGEDEDEMPPGNGFARLDDDQQPVEKLLRHRLYFAMPSEDALKSLLSLWRRYEREEPFGAAHSPKLTAWRDVFDNLDDVRPWGPQDRLPPDIVLDRFMTSDDDDIIRISFKNVRFEHNTREILMNVIGRFLLNRARADAFRDGPMITVLDEAHQFLGRVVADEYANVRLDAFGLSAK